MNKWITFSAGLLLSIMIVSSALAREKISLVTLEWPPYAGPSLKNNGFHSEIVTTVFEKMGYSVNITYRPWKRALAEAQIGKFDVVYCAYYTKERAEQFAISDPYGQDVLGFFEKVESNITWNTLDDLAPYNIAITLGYAQTPAFDNAKNLKKDTSPTDLVSLKKLLAGRVDLATISKFVGYHLINNEIPDAIGKIKFQEKPLARKNLYLLFSRNTINWQQKLADFNDGLKKINEDGTYDSILKKHGFIMEAGASR